MPDAPSYATMKQDVRSELGHGHQIEHELTELEKFEEALASSGRSGFNRTKRAREYLTMAEGVHRDLRDEGLPFLADAVVERAREHHPDRYEYGRDPYPEFDIGGGL